jgi:tetrahydromethanopterin S-methyltransferase subunit B
VFAAKSIVRREDMKNDSLFYLAGTLVNFTYSIVVGLVVWGYLVLW